MKAPQFSQEVLAGFIVFEGLDGAGSSTQAAILKNRLEDAGRRVLLSSEPTPGPVGTLIKQMMRGRLAGCPTREETERQLAYLFAADRHDHLYNRVDGVRGRLDDGYLLISTRYHFSSFAYNASNEKAWDLVERLNRDFPLPELVVYLTCPLEVSLARLDRRDLLEFYEQEEEQRRVRDAYEAVLAPLGDRVLRFESTGDPMEVADAIEASVLSRIGNRGK